jgi:hypothetical protein
MSSPWRRLILCCCLAVAVGGAGHGAWPAQAAYELGRAGNTGLHGLTDTAESPGATCRFALPLSWSLGETWIQVRPPVMFARDTTERIDEQLVGWRAVISVWDPASGAFKPLVLGQTQRALAAENRAARFDSRGEETQFHVGYGSYIVLAELFWYERLGANEQPRLAGQVTYQIGYYAIAVRDRAGTRPVDVNQRCQLPM